MGEIVPLGSRVPGLPQEVADLVKNVDQILTAVAKNMNGYNSNVFSSVTPETWSFKQ